MELSVGIMLVLAAGFLQGTFVLPMTLVKNWKWEHIRLTFSTLGMVGLNRGLVILVIALAVIGLSNIF